MAETLQNMSAKSPAGEQYIFIVTQLAAEYSASNTYALGDYCVRQGQLYRCTTEITTAEAWNAAHWTAVYIADEVAAKGGSVTVDPALSATSENPVQNKALYEALENKIAAPASPSFGQFLVYNGTAWTAQTVPSASGVNF